MANWADRLAKLAQALSTTGVVPDAKIDAAIARDSELPTDATIATTDVTTNNVSTSKHGWAPKAPNDATKFLDGTGAYAVPPGTGLTNPMTTAADLIVGGASGVPARLAKGSDSQVLTVDPTTHLLVWATPTGGGSGAPTTVDYLVGTADGGLSNEIVVGTTPGGELGGTWASPTVDATHSGSSHAGLSGQPGSTDVAVADGGTGASTAADARTNLGLVIGTDVSAAISIPRTRFSPAGTIEVGLPTLDAIFAMSTTVDVANFVRYTPMIFPHAVALDQVLFEVTAAPASNANQRMGIYAADTDWQPTGAPLFDATVAVAAAFTGVKTTTISVTIPAGIYLATYNQDVQFTHRVFKTGAHHVNPALGASPMDVQWTVAQTYGALPNPGTKWTTTGGASNTGIAHVLVYRWTLA